MKKITLLFIIAAFISGTAITKAQTEDCDYFEDFATGTQGTISHQSGTVLVYSSTNKALTFDASAGQGGSRTSIYTLAAGGVDFEKKATVEFDYYTSSVFGGTGPMVVSRHSSHNG